MRFNGYRWLASTYRPVELGWVELETLDHFANKPSSSVYQVYKTFKEKAERRMPSWRRDTKPTSYKNIHKRVKRLNQLRLIEGVEGHFERGAKYYRISSYGLITYIGKTITEWHAFIYYNKDNIVIRSLLLEAFEEETIDSFYTLKEFPTRDIEEYLHDCCSTTLNICKNFWEKIKQYNLEDILPSDTIIQKYVSHLDGKPVERYVLDEMEEYRKRLITKLNDNNGKEHEKLVAAVNTYNRIHPKEDLYLPNNKNYDGEVPPFPLMDIYRHIVLELEFILETKIRFLAFDLVSQLGEMVTIGEPIESQEELEEEILEYGRDYSLRHILKDKKFIELVRSIKSDFDRGYKQFLYYH